MVAAPPDPTVPRFPVLIGGLLRRAEVGHGHPLHDDGGGVVGHAFAAARDDVAAAVAAARGALPAWSATAVHERGRLLHGVAERLDEHVRGDDTRQADELRAAADRWIWYAGWTDKVAGLLGAVHPAAGPFLSWSTPRPVGVVGALAPGSPLAMADCLGAALAVGATAVVVAPVERAAEVAQLAEVLATAELPAGAANLLTGNVSADVLVGAGVDGLDLTDAPVDDPIGPTGRRVRVLRPGAGGLATDRHGVARLRKWSAPTTVWQSVGR